MAMVEEQQLEPAARDDAYQRRVREALDAVFARSGNEPLLLDGEKDRYVVFSDQHRGIRNSTDAFRDNERAYNAALAWYYRAGYTLVVLGDAEELWENHPPSVLKVYEHSLALEAQFHREGRYYRVWGNHDDEWQHREPTEKHLQPRYGPPRLPVQESLRFVVRCGGKEAGELFMVHGHQGSSMSDRWSRYSRLAVRFFWRPLQRLFKVSYNTPAQDWMLRERHNIALYSWAARRQRFVLIAGHTHRPVFESQSRATQLREELAAVEAKLAEAPDDEHLRRYAASLAAELEWVRAQDRQRPGLEGAMGLAPNPCYFNTGCCCFSDGSITGIELDEGEIRLVRWPDHDGRPKPTVLERDTLQGVFDRCVATAT